MQFRGRQLKQARPPEQPHLARAHLDVAPTELSAILLSDCYKDFAPTELRWEFVTAGPSSVRSEIFIATSAKRAGSSVGAAYYLVTPGVPVLMMMPVRRLMGRSFSWLG